MTRNNTDWVAIARSLGHNKYVSKQLALAFQENNNWSLLRDEKFLDFFRNVVVVNDDACGSGCCSSQSIVGPNGCVEFYLGWPPNATGIDEASWLICEGYLNGAKFQNYPQWLSQYRRRLRLIRAARTLEKA